MQIFFSYRYIHGGMATNMLRFEVSHDTRYEATRIVEPEYYNRPSDDGDDDFGFHWYRTCNDRNEGYETEPVTDFFSLAKRYSAYWYSGNGEDLKRAKAFLSLLKELSFKNNRNFIWGGMTDSVKDEFKNLFFPIKHESLNDEEKKFVNDHLYRITDRFMFLNECKKRIVRMAQDYEANFRWSDAKNDMNRNFLFKKGNFYVCWMVTASGCFRLTGLDNFTYTVPARYVENGQDFGWEHV